MREFAKNLAFVFLVVVAKEVGWQLGGRNDRMPLPAYVVILVTAWVLFFYMEEKYARSTD